MRLLLRLHLALRASAKAEAREQINPVARSLQGAFQTNNGR